jgi:hypothetical protein
MMQHSGNHWSFMYITLAQYSAIITTQAKALLHSNILGLNQTQRSAFRTINLHAAKLAQTVESLSSMRDDNFPQYIIKQIEHIVAPIQRYAELLTTAWVGQLSHDQMLHVEIILNSALDLAHLLGGQHSDTRARA